MWPHWCLHPNYTALWSEFCIVRNHNKVLISSAVGQYLNEKLNNS